MSSPSVSRLLLVAVLVVTLNTQAVFLLGASFFQIGPEFGLGTVGLGALTAAFFLTAAVTSAPLGRWVQRVGWQRAMRINFRATALLLATISVAARSTWVFAGLLVFAAGIYGMSNPAANQALADHTSPERQATVFGAKHAGIPASTLLAGLAVPTVVLNFGWRWAYGVAALLALVLSFWIPRGRATVHSAIESRPRTAESVLSTRNLLALAFGSAFATWAAVALGTFLVSGAVDAGFSEGAAGTLQFAGSACSIATRVGIGHLTDRRRGTGFGGIVMMAGLGAVLFVLLPQATGPLFAAIVLGAFATGWGWPGLMTFTVVNSNRSMAASSSAVTQAGVFLGAGIGPLLMGGAISRWSFDAAWLLAGGGLVVASVVVARVGTVAVRTGRRPPGTGSA